MKPPRNVGCKLSRSPQAAAAPATKKNPERGEERGMNENTSVAEITFTAFDFETTGLSPVSDGICEIGAVQFRNGEVVDTFQALTNPGVKISPDAQAVSGLSNEQVANAPEVGVVLPDFLGFAKDTVMIAHNAEFDMGFLRVALQKHSLPEIPNIIIDTQALAQKAFPRRRSYSLQALAEHLGVDPGSAHRALDDALTCMKIFNACVEQLSFMGDLPLSEVLF